MHVFPCAVRVTLLFLAISTQAACTSMAAHRADTSAVTALPATVSAPVTTTEVASPQEGYSNGQSYVVRFTDIAGSTTDNIGKWNAQAGSLSGGDQQVVNVFNAASQNSINDLIKTVNTEAHADSWTLNAKSTISFQPLAVSQVTTGVYYGESAAHPIDYVATIVIDSRDAQPITLNRLFNNEQDGLNRISEQIRLIQHLDTDGNAPVEKNFANWIPVDKGLEVHFSDYQSGHGLPVFTVPWSALTDVLAPDMRALAHD